MFTCDVNLEGKMLNARFIIILKGFLAVRNQLVRGSGPLKMIHKEKKWVALESWDEILQKLAHFGYTSAWSTCL